MLRGKTIIETITTDQPLTLKRCVLVGLTNVGAANVYVGSGKLVTNATANLGSGTVELNQDILIRFDGTGSKELLVVKTVIDDCQ